MEPIQGTCSKASKSVSDEDIISTMPEKVITNIMDRLEIGDAVRTGILSRNWRFKWTFLTQLVFDSEFFEHLHYINHESYYGRILISRLLLQLKGALTKFSLYIPDECFFEDTNSWVMFLSRKGIEEFTLINRQDIPLKLPTQLFSCLGLKHLELYNCCIFPMPSFCGFPNLLSLNLNVVRFGGYKCGEFLGQSPLLENLKICYNSVTGEMKQIVIAKLENLKVLSLPLCKLDSMTTITCSSTVQLMGVFTKLQELTLDFWDCKLLAEAGARKTVITILPCVKILTLCNIEFNSGVIVACAIELICASPNLQTLKITAAYRIDAVPLPAFCSSEVDYSRMGQLQLRNVALDVIRGWENEACLIKSLLSSSPLLKNMSILARSSHGSRYDRGEMIFATKLLTFHRASPIAEVNLRWVL